MYTFVEPNITSNHFRDENYHCFIFLYSNPRLWNWLGTDPSTLYKIISKDWLFSQDRLYRMTIKDLDDRKPF